MLRGSVFGCISEPTIKSNDRLPAAFASRNRDPLAQSGPVFGLISEPTINSCHIHLGKINLGADTPVGQRAFHESLFFK